MPLNLSFLDKLFFRTRADTTAPRFGIWFESQCNRFLALTRSQIAGQLRKLGLERSASRIDRLDILKGPNGSISLSMAILASLHIVLMISFLTTLNDIWGQVKDKHKNAKAEKLRGHPTNIVVIPAPVQGEEKEH